MVVQVIRAALLYRSEGPRQSGADQEQCGNAPPVIRVENPAQPGLVQVPPQGLPPGPHRTEGNTEPQEVNCREEPTHEHAPSSAPRGARAPGSQGTRTAP